MAVIWGVYDARESSWWGLSEDERQRFKDWALQQGIPYDGRSIYRSEIHGVENLRLRVYRFRLDEQGRKYIDRQTDDVAKQEPQDYPITSLPPVAPGREQRA